MRHFLTLKDFTKDEILEMLSLAEEIKAQTKAGHHEPYLNGQVLGMIFEKSSTRTRVSFEVGIHQLGGKGLFLSANDLQLGRGEPMKDTARVIGRMVDLVMIRTFSQSTLEEFARYSNAPVISGLSDLYHPVQIMADYLTMQEYSRAENPVVAYVGDGNNIVHSWMMLASKLGFTLRIATPKGYEPNAQVTQDALAFAAESGAVIELMNDPKKAVEGADVVTTDTWVSMGQEAEKEKRLRDFQGFMVDDAMMARAKEGAMFLHCLPAYRDYEVSEAVFEAHADEIFDEAENRLHVQKGIMVWLDRQKKE